MRLLVNVHGKEGLVVGYAPGKKGRPLAIVVIDGKLQAVKLRNLELLGYAKVKAARSDHGAQVTSELLHWSPGSLAQ
jgi:hypothetical protein